MKKNLMSVVILALVLANLILTAVLTISVLPQTKLANELITKVCAAIDLDLEGGSASGNATIPLDQVETYNVNAGETMTINLKPGADGVNHYVVMEVTLGVNTKHEDYKKYGSAEQLAAKEGMIKDKIFSVVSGHTIDDMRNDQKSVQNEILEELRSMYNSDFLVSVSCTSTYQ